MKNFNWEKFKKGEIIIHCDTEEKTSDFLKQCHDKGITWNGGDSLLDYSHWDIHEENTCYRYILNNDNLVFCSLDYYKRENYKIIEWEIE